jgi:hypothetical protein
MRKLLVATSLPALAIGIAAVAQLTLTALWPAITQLPSVGISIDSYVASIVMVILSFLAGRWVRNNVQVRGVLLALLIVPVAWVAIGSSPLLMTMGRIDWSLPLNHFIVASALAPLIAVVAGWIAGASRQSRLAPSNNTLQRTRGGGLR